MDYIQKKSGEVHLNGKVFHHVFDVCRQTKGDLFDVISSDGKSRRIEVVEHSKKKAILKILSTQKIAPLPMPYIELCIGISRYPVMDKVIEKAVELGVSRIRPFVSDHSFIKKQENIPSSKWARWQRIIRSASQQCGRGPLMVVEGLSSLEELFETLRQETNSQGLFLYEGVAQKSLKEVLQQISNISSLWVFIGGERGFSDQEVEKFAKFNMESLTLGPQVLRVETACIALLSILSYELG